MMTNLFSNFVPSTNILSLSINWMSTFSAIIMIPMAFWFIPSRYMIIWNMMINILHKEF